MFKTNQEFGKFEFWKFEFARPVKQMMGYFIAI
jgi:hypothetical protein